MEDKKEWNMPYNLKKLTSIYKWDPNRNAC